MRVHPSARRTGAQTGATAVLPESAAEQLVLGWRLRQSEVSVPPAPGISKAVSRELSISRQKNKRQKGEEIIRNQTAMREQEQEAGGLF